MISGLCNNIWYNLPKKGGDPVIGVCLDGTGPNHLTGAKMPKEAKATNFTLALLESFSEQEINHLEIALEIVKKEIRNFFGI